MVKRRLTGRGNIYRENFGIQDGSLTARDVQLFLDDVFYVWYKIVSGLVEEEENEDSGVFVHILRQNGVFKCEREILLEAGDSDKVNGLK